MKNKTRTILIILDICLIVIFTCLLFFYYQLYNPLDRRGEEKVFIIEERQGLEKIAQNLEQQKIIRNSWVFVYYLWLKQQTGKLQAGKYNLSPSMTIPEVARKIVKGEVIKDWIKVTIPEGWTNKQIKERLVNLGLISQDKNISLELQGYLFPDTYYFEKKAPIEEIIKRMQDNFNKKITEDLKAEIKKQNKNLYQILIMASLLEKEVKSDKDRAIVAGIFWKRLENNYPLESCATIAYILEVDKWRYSIEETKIKSPYNTYLNIGLPPTPINNPGLSTIKAAVYPEYTDYNFFLTDPETGQTIFSKTLEEHNANKRRYF